MRMRISFLPRNFSQILPNERPMVSGVVVSEGHAVTKKWTAMSSSLLSVEY